MRLSSLLYQCGGPTAWLLQGLPVQADGQAAWKANKIIFINDVAFCAKDAVRLASHEADLACGLDFAATPVGLSLSATFTTQPCSRGNECQ